MILEFPFLKKYNKPSISKLVTIKYTSSSFSIPIFRLASDRSEPFVQIIPENETNSNTRLLDIRGLPKKSHISCKNFIHMSNFIASAH